MDKKYFELLKEINMESISMEKLYILSCCSMETDELNWAVMEYTYKCWLDADTDLDLAKLTAIVIDHWKGIETDRITTEEIIEICLM